MPSSNVSGIKICVWLLLGQKHQPCEKYENKRIAQVSEFRVNLNIKW
jgi:hypothetical protein